MNRWPIIIIVLLLLWGGTARAEEEVVYFSGYTCVSSDYQVWSWDILTWFDYETGLVIPLCTKPDCKHEHRTPAASEADEESLTFGEKLTDDRQCYARRTIGMETGPVLLWRDKIYLIEWFPDVRAEQNTLAVWESTVDGPARKLADLGSLFPWEFLPESPAALIYDGTLFLSVTCKANPYISEETAVPPQEETAAVYCVDLATGEYRELLSLRGKHCSFNPLTAAEGVLYYSYSHTAPYEATADFHENRDVYQAELEANTVFGLKGIRVKTGEEVILDRRIAQMGLQDSMKNFDCNITGRKLCVLMNPAISGVTDGNKSVYEIIDLGSREILQTGEGPLLDYHNGFSPYCQLSDDKVLCYLFSKGEFSIYDFSTGETVPLPFHGYMGAAEGEETFDLSAETVQTEYIVFGAPNGQEKAYLTRQMLLNGIYGPVPLDWLN